MTLKLYRADPYLLEFEAHVVACFEHDGRPIVQLDRTAFYAESGGQPCDRGFVADVAVLDVQEQGNVVWHVLEHALPAQVTRVTGRVDAARRRDHMQQHHGQHLLSRALLERADARTVGFHLGAEETTIDLDRAPTPAELDEAVLLANARVWESLPVQVRDVDAAEAARLGCASPAGIEGPIRLVAAGAFDIQPCGGTHPRRTSEVGVILVLGSERHKGGSRVRFVCGERALQASRLRCTLLDRLGARFSVPWHELDAAAQRSLDAQAELRARLEAWTSRALTEEAQRLLDAPQADASAPSRPRVVACAVAPRGPAELRNLALAMVGLVPCAALLAAPDGQGASSLVFARSPGLTIDIAAALREALARLGGRGGGRGDVVQGGAPTAAGLTEALAAAATQVRGAPPA